METRTVIERIEVDAQFGTVGVRIQKQVVGDNGKVISFGYHRMAIAPTDDPLAILAGVTAHLKQMGYPEFVDAELALLDAILASGPVADLRAAKAADANAAEASASG
jgi:hypothetical protein